MARFIALLCSWLLATLLVAGTGGAWAAAAESPGRAAIIAADVAVEVDGGHTRFKITLSRDVAVQTRLMERPDRLIVDLPEVAFRLPAETGRKPAGVIASYRYGLFAPGQSRVVMDLVEPAVVSSVRSEPSAMPGAAILVIELSRVGRDEFHKAALSGAAKQGAEMVAAAVAPETAKDSRPLIVIDPGHGGVDPGANSLTGLYEKDLVLSFAKLLKKKLEADGRYRVAMTRDRDVFIALDERVHIARRAQADLFISIHADSISGGQGVRGLTIYTCSDRASDADSAQLADRENRSDSIAGVDVSDAPDEVMDILQDLTSRETRTFSHRFASGLVSELDSVARLNKNPRREAGFRVLKAYDVPSVLVELGYLSSREDLDLLTSDAWRSKAIASMSVAIERFFALRLARQGAAAVLP